jgi:2-oxoglutarate dehydrogenase E2 component (dihydrolipoamide succinyltransferase)
VELDQIEGSGKGGRVTKNDMLAYIEKRSQTSVSAPIQTPPSAPASLPTPTAPIVRNGTDEIIEMTRMGKLISKHMINSVQTSAHVQSFIEVDVTRIWNWREKIKAKFQENTGEKITFTPIFMEAVAKALTIHPMLNISVDGDHIIKHKSINLGMATALADGNLIVPVIKNADQLNLMGMTKRVNDLAVRARNNQLNPDDIQDGTYTVTNVGGFGSIMGTPIINQPQVGILALGAIRKVPAVIETNEGDFIGIRQKMFLSHSYDHRVVNGALGGQFLKTVKELLESWDENRQV